MNGPVVWGFIGTPFNDNNPNDAAKCAREAVEDGSVAVVGSFTVYGKQVTDILSAAGIPYVGSGAITEAEYSCKTCYQFDAGSARRETP